MNKKILIRGALLILALVAGYLLVTTGGEDSESDQRPGGPNGGGMARGGPGGGFGPASVEVAPVSRGDFVASAEFVGTLQARATADLYAKLNGQILEMRSDTGDRVRAGQVLARIDPGELNERVDQARAAQRMAEATLGERRAALGIARSTAERTRALFEQQLVSQQQHDQAQAEMQGAAAQVQVAEASVSQARANVGAAGAELEKALIIAPFSGVIGKRYLDKGAFAATNRPVFSMVDLSTIKTTVPLTEKDAGRVRVGQAATVTLESDPAARFQGIVARIASVFDPNTNTTEAEVEIANADGRLKPGMFANVSIAFAVEPGALLVPRSAVVEDERDTFLFLAEKSAAPPGPPDENGEGADLPSWTAKRVAVKRIGTGTDPKRDQVAIEGPVQPGQSVITLGQQELRDGAPVMISGSGNSRRAAGA
ncbi:MAG TPA: efflux RND transporter periplasmic adaptor subunit [Thermoanaerobaculia bacterium]|nr:efflux RND transporter periplasmic adaptor subunit [Thermoanaerobaculia bacterium]